MEHKLVYYDNFPVCETQVLLPDMLERHTCSGQAGRGRFTHVKNLEF